jgi:NuA3 HAT complex component NTO1
VEARFYTTALSFAHDFGDLFRIGIITEPPPRVETASEAQSSSPSKKPVLDIKERKRLAKRIIKAVQPQLEVAVQTEANISGKPFERLKQELFQLLEAEFQPSHDSISVSLGESGSVAEHDLDVDMQDADQAKSNGIEKTHGGSSSDQGNEENNARYESLDVEMQDADAQGEEIDDEDAIVAIPDGDSEADETTDTSVTTKALAEVNGNVSQVKPNHANGLKNTNTPPDSNGYVTAPEALQPSPPTPPISNGDTNPKIDHTDILTNGGVPWYLKDFEPEGTSLLPGGTAPSSSFTEDLSDLDEDDLKGRGLDVADAEVVSAVAATSPSKTRKGKAKKKPSRKR